MRKRDSDTAAARISKAAAGAAARAAPKAERSVSDDLRVRIERCELMPGARLKFEDLRNRYDVSIGALREELAILEFEGVVCSERNKGYQVSPVSVKELLDLTELRIFLERKALAESINAGDEAWEVRIVSSSHLLTRTEEKRTDAIVLDPIWAKRHRGFHLALLSACPSEWTLRYCKQLMQLLHRYLCLSVRLRGGTSNRSFSDHERLTKLALARDAKQACDVLDRHLRATTDVILKSIASGAGFLAK